MSSNAYPFIRLSARVPIHLFTARESVLLVHACTGACRGGADIRAGAGMFSRGCVFITAGSPLVGDTTQSPPPGPSDLTVPG